MEQREDATNLEAVFLETVVSTLTGTFENLGFCSYCLLLYKRVALTTCKSFVESDGLEMEKEKVISLFVLFNMEDVLLL